LKKNDLPKAWATLSKNGTCSIIDTLVADIIKQSYLKPDVMQGEEASYDMLKLRDFMFERVYISPEAKNQEVKANKMIGLLYDYLTENPSEVPAFYRNVSNEKAQFITDYIAGMTDHFAVKTFREIFEPKFWEN
jgi:dGTPase